MSLRDWWAEVKAQVEVDIARELAKPSTLTRCMDCGWYLKYTARGPRYKARWVRFHLFFHRGHTIRDFDRPGKS